MKRVAKVIIENAEGKFLLLKLNNHPTFEDDMDLPGGTVDGDELDVEAAMREVKEETGIDVSSENMKCLYSGDEYSTHGTFYSLFSVRLPDVPSVTLSWEHSAIKWASRDETIMLASKAKDTYMQMVADILRTLK